MMDLKAVSKTDGIVLFISLLTLILSLFCLSDSLLIPSDSSHNLIPVVHSRHNAYFQLTSLGLWASSSAGINVLLLFGILGLTAVLSYHRVLTTLSLAISTSVFGIISAIFQSDFTILGPLSCLPWLYLLISNADFARTSFSVLFATVLVTCWLLLYSLCLPTLMLALIINQIVANKPLPGRFTLLVFCGGMIILVFTALSPAMPWPDYPNSARVSTMIDGPPWLARPLIGIDLPFSSLDRASVVSFYNYLLLPLAIILLGTGLIVRNFPAAGRTWLCCAVGIVLVYFDFKLPEELAQIAPLQSLPRLLPELYLIPLSPIILALSIAALIIVIMLIALPPFMAAICGLSFTLILTLAANAGIAAVNYQSLPPAWIKSPSHFVTSFFTPAVMENAASKSRNLRPNASLVSMSSDDSSSADITAVLDRDLQTRWSSGRGKQTGKEWLMFAFQSEQKIIGIELLTGKFKTDFPRGLAVKAGKSCSPEDLNTISTYSDWQGSPGFTPKGYPYFSAQSEVRVFFPEEVSVSCIRIEQTGNSDHFDWSVAEFRLIRQVKII